MSPNPPRTAQQSPYCWECIRRNVICDGALPTCNRCRMAKIVCPGYNDQKPLTWLPVGRVTRLRNSATRKAERQKPVIDSASASPSGSSTVDVSDSDGSSSSNDIASLGHRSHPLDEAAADISRSAAMTLRKQRQARFITSESQFVLKLPLEMPSAIEWDVGDLNYVAAYHESQVMPIVLSKRLAPGYTIPITGAFLAYAAPCTRYNLIALTISYRIMALSKQHRIEMEPATSGPVARLWSNFYRTIGLGIRALNDEIHQNGPNKLPNMMTSIAFLLTAEIGVLSSPVWRAHATGFCSLIKYSGGILKAIENPLTPPFLFQAFLALMIVSNTTSPRHGQVSDINDFTTEEVMTVYNSGYCPFFTCPGPLFLQIMRINSLRRQVTMEKSAQSLSDGAIKSILDDIKEFSVDDWIKSESAPDSKEYQIVLHIFQAAVALFCLLSLPLMFSDLGPELKKLVREYRIKLFKLLDIALRMPVKMDHLFWPFVVAGVAAKAGTITERFYVEEYMYSIMKDHMVGKPPEMALAVLQRFWASDSLSWDDCFDQTYILLVF